MAIVLIARPHGLLGRPQVAARGAAAEPEAPIRPASRTARDSWRRRSPRADRVAVVGALVALCAGARRRCADRGAVRHQPAFHHGPGRHGVVRPRRLFRPRRLRRGFGGEMARRADGRRSRCGPGRGRARRACCSAGSRSGCPASISPCLRSPLPRSSGRSCSNGRSLPAAPMACSASGRASPSIGFPHSFFSRLCSSSPAFCCCGACCSRRSATPCARAAIRRCERRPSAST